MAEAHEPLARVEDVGDDLAGVAELLDELATSRTQRLEVVDDVDVFDRYYAEHPDEDVFEVFDE